MSARPHVTIGHLFPRLLNLYGDRGNVEVLVRRAAWRGIEAEVRSIDGRGGRLLRGCDVILVGGGADEHQQAVAQAMMDLRGPLRAALRDGAALLAVCAGYQCLGHRYRSPGIGEIRGPGIFDVETEVPPDGSRLVGAVVVELRADLAAVMAGFDVRADPVPGQVEGAPLGGGRSVPRSARLVGFENHAGRTRLGPAVRPLGRVIVGRGNDELEADEGAVALPGDDGIAGLRIGTYLHGPLLPRNPHLADLLLSCGMARGLGGPLEPLPDEAEWVAHRSFEADWTAIQPGVVPRSRVGRLAHRLQGLIGF